MNQKKLTLILAMLVLAVFAVGAVSAADNVTADIDEPASDIVIDDVPAVETDENEPADLDAAESNSGSGDDSGLSAMTVINFAPGTYRGTTITVQSNTIYNGNGATIYGTGSNDVFVVDNAHDFIITGFNIIVNSTSNIAIHGANVENATIYNNNITGGKDGINIKQTYENINITGNRIDGVVRDAISLVDHETDGSNGFDFSSWASSTISNNIITGSSQYGMFLGGNFKGTISNNVIDVTGVGIEFAGKKASTNGKLNATLYNNTISNCNRGINMFHPNVQYLYLDLMVFDNLGDYDINTASPFGTYSYIGVYNSTFYNGVTFDFYNATGSNKGNNTNFIYY